MTGPRKPADLATAVRHLLAWAHHATGGAPPAEVEVRHASMTVHRSEPEPDLPRAAHS